MKAPPKVFISHASEDKERFVLPFYQRLRSRGIDAWLDTFEMLPGDKLVTKVFEEGLKQSDAVIVVLSTVSITKPFVRKELDTAVIKSISENTRLISIRLDSCEIPYCLKDTIYQEVPDVNSFDNSFERIVSAIYGQYQKPPLGPSPEYVKKTTEDVYGDLCKLDSMIFGMACEHIVDREFSEVESDWLEAETKKVGLTTDQVAESQEVLKNKGFVEGPWIGPGRISNMRITEVGFNHFARTREDFEDALHQVALMIVRDGCNESLDMVTKSGLKHRHVEHALFVLEDRGYIRTSPLYGCGNVNTSVDYCSPELRRDIESN